MKTFFWLIIGLGIILLILMLGNALQCRNQRGVDSCSAMCNSRPVVCDLSLVDDKNCTKKLDCYAPHLDQYPQIIEKYLETLKPKR